MVGGDSLQIVDATPFAVTGGAASVR